MKRAPIVVSQSRPNYPKPIHVHCAVAWGYQPLDALVICRMSDGTVRGSFLRYTKRTAS